MKLGPIPTNPDDFGRLRKTIQKISGQAAKKSALSALSQIVSQVKSEVLILDSEMSQTQSRVLVLESETSALQNFQVSAVSALSALSAAIVIAGGSCVSLASVHSQTQSRVLILESEVSAVQGLTTAVDSQLLLIESGVSQMSEAFSQMGQDFESADSQLLSLIYVTSDVLSATQVDLDLVHSLISAIQPIYVNEYGALVHTI